MFAELESGSLILNPLGRCYLKASQLIKYRQLTLGHHLRDGDGGDGKFHQSCCDKHLRLSRGESRLVGQDLLSISFQGVSKSMEGENCVFCLAVLNAKAFNGNSHHAGGTWCWGNSVCWELERGHQFIPHILFLQETQHN